MRIGERKYLLIYIPVIIALTFIIYSNTLENDFQLDDNHVVLNNEKIKSLENFTDYSAWEKILFNRQLAYLTVAINYAIHGYEVFGYHLFNIFIHSVNSLLVFLLVILLFKTPVLIRNSIHKDKLHIAFFTALIFMAHPIQIQAVGYITQRMVSLAVMFYLLSCILFIMVRLRTITAKLNWKSILLILAIVISFQLGSYSKEIILTLPATLLLLEYIFIRKVNGKHDYTVIFLFLIGIILASLLVLFTGLPRQTGSIDRYSYFLTEINVLVTYLRLMLLPINLHLFYDYPISETLLELKTIFSLLILTTLLIAAILSIKKYPVFTFAIAFFFITQTIESSIFPLQYVIFEYRLYPSVFGFSFLISFYSFHFFQERMKLRFLLLSAIVIVFSVMTFNQNKVWQNGSTLWSNNINMAPEHPKPYNYLGHYFLLSGQFERALPYFNKSIELDSTYTDPLNHRGIIYKETRRYIEAMKDFNKAIKINPKLAMSYNNRGYVEQAVGRYEYAVDDFKKAIQLNPKYHNAMKNLSVVLQIIKQNEEALIYAKSAVFLDSGNADYFNNRGNAYFALGYLDSAITDFRKSVEINPKFHRGWNNIGVVFMKQEKYDDAVKYFDKSIQLNSNFIDAYFNRAYCFYHIQKIVPSLNDLQKCFQLNSSHPGASALYNKIYSEQTSNTPKKY